MKVIEVVRDELVEREACCPRLRLDDVLRSVLAGEGSGNGEPVVRQTRYGLNIPQTLVLGARLGVPSAPPEGK
jgi:hypothetical protein